MRPGSDEGFTFVEMVASLTVLAIGVVAVIGVMNSSFRVASVTASRSKGIAVASMEIERLRSIPYDQLTVQLPTETAQQRTEGRYNIRTTVTKEDEQTGTNPTTNAYRKAIVWVNWSDETGSHDVYQTTLIYPGGLGAFNAATSINTATNSGGNPAPPTNLLAVPLTNVTGIDLAWSPPANSNPEPVAWIVQASKDPTFPTNQVQEVTATLPAAITMLRVDDLAPSTTYHFRVFSKAENGRLSSTAATALDVTTGASLALLCNVGAATVTPNAVYKKKGNEGSGLASDPRVELSTTGNCSGLTFRMQYSPRTSVIDDVLLASGSNGTYAGMVKGTTQTWEVGDHDVEVFSYNSSGVKMQRASLRLIVCDSQKKVCP